MVKVRLYGDARKLAGQAEASLELTNGATLKTVLSQLSGDSAGIPAGIASTILINGCNCAFNGGLDAQVSDGDLIEVLPVISGG